VGETGAAGPSAPRNPSSTRITTVAALIGPATEASGKVTLGIGRSGLSAYGRRRVAAPRLLDADEHGNRERALAPGIRVHETARSVAPDRFPERP